MNEVYDKDTDIPRTADERRERDLEMIRAELFGVVATAPQWDADAILRQEA